MPPTPPAQPSTGRPRAIVGIGVSAGGTGLDAAGLDSRLRDGDAGNFALILWADGVPILFITGYGQRLIPEDLADVPMLGQDSAET